MRADKGPNRSLRQINLLISCQDGEASLLCAEQSMSLF